MNCLFCPNPTNPDPDDEADCSDPTTGKIHETSCRTCDTYYFYSYDKDNNPYIFSYRIRTNYKDKRYMLRVYMNFDQPIGINKVLYSATLQVINFDPFAAGKVQHVCEFETYKNQITPSNFKQKLPTLLAFS